MSHILAATLCAVASGITFSRGVNVWYDAVEGGYQVEVDAFDLLMAIAWAGLAGWLLWTA